MNQVLRDQVKGLARNQGNKQQEHKETTCQIKTTLKKTTSETSTETTLISEQINISHVKKCGEAIRSRNDTIEKKKKTRQKHIYDLSVYIEHRMRFTFRISLLEVLSVDSKYVMLNTKFCPSAAKLRRTLHAFFEIRFFMCFLFVSYMCINCFLSISQLV